jgi:AraC-like DNA-binding protein
MSVNGKSLHQLAGEVWWTSVVGVASAVSVSAMSPRRSRTPRRFTPDHRKRLDRAVEHYLLFCYGQKTAARASEFATRLGRTPEYLSWLATRVLGKSLRDYLREKQVARAARLLRTTPLSVEEIALRAGFGTAGTLYRWFKASYGTSPGAYRQLKK